MSIQLLAGPTVTVEAAFTAATGSFGIYGTAIYDTSTYGPDVVYQDISRWARTFKTDRQFSRNLNVWESGNCSVKLDDNDRRFSPDNLAGPYVSAGVTGIRPWRPMRIRASYAGVTYDVFTGYTRKFEPRWEPGHVDATQTIGGVDVQARLSRFDGLAVAPVGAGESSGARIHRILNNANHTGPRNIAVGTNTVQDTTLAANAVTEMKLVTDSEGGALFVDADGTVCFEDRYALIEQSRSNTIQATFGDGTGGELECADIQSEYNGDEIINIASYARAGGTAQTFADDISRALDEDMRATRSDLVCETDAQVLALATFDVNRLKDAEQRVRQITIRPQADPTRLWPQALGRRVRDLIRVVVRPIGGGTITQDCHIAGIHHDTDGEQWTTTFDLRSATVYQAFFSSRYDFATYDSSPYYF